MRVKDSRQSQAVNIARDYYNSTDADTFYKKIWGGGYGGVARYITKRFGCLIDCVNISERQNTFNRQLNSSEGLSELIHVYDANFEDIPFDNSSFNVVWAQDSIVHSGNRAKIVSEAERVLCVDGFFIFTDIIQIEDIP